MFGHLPDAMSPKVLQGGEAVALWKLAHPARPMLPNYADHFVSLESGFRQRVPPCRRSHEIENSPSNVGVTGLQCFEQHRWRQHDL
jgi:hypothetical protein